MTNRRTLLCGAAAILLWMTAYGCGGGNGGSGSNTTGGIVTSSDNRASVTVQDNAGVSARQITVTPADSASLPASDGLVDGTAYNFNPSGSQFTTPVMVSIKYVSAQLRAGISESSLKLFTVSNGDWQPVPNSTVDTTQKTVSASVSHFTVFAILSPNGFAGTFTGHYTGTNNGTFTMNIAESGKITVNGTDPRAGAFSGAGSLTLAGNASVSATGNGGASNGATFTFVGAFQKDGSTVTSTGTWTGSGGASGTWSIP